MINMQENTNEQNVAGRTKAEGNTYSGNIGGFDERLQKMWSTSAPNDGAHPRIPRDGASTSGGT